MPEHVRIVWRHVGREHVTDGYAPDIRLNPPEIVENYLAAKERGRSGTHQCLRIDADTYVEAPQPESGEDWIIVYLADLGLQFSRGYKPFDGWIVDVVRVTERSSGCVCVADLFIDVKISADRHVSVEDLDEFAVALRLGVLTAEVAADVESLGTALRMAVAADFPGLRVLDAATFSRTQPPGPAGILACQPTCRILDAS